MEPHDDPDIKNCDYLIRRISKVHHIVRDENFNCYRISTKAFQVSSGTSAGMSVDILRLIEEADENPREFVLDSLGSGAVMFEAQIPRSRGLRVGKEPLEANPYHGEVWPIESRPRFTKSERRFLLEHSKWFVEIEAVRLHVGSPIVQTQTQPK